MGLIDAQLFLMIVSGVVSQSADQPPNTVPGYLNEDVILPCNCSNRNLEKGFKWQLETGTKKVIFNMNATLVDKAYKSRVEAFLQENDNCSIRLKNLTADDNATYLCVFEHNGIKRHLVNLHVEQRPTEALIIANPPDPPRHPRQNFIIFPIIVLLLVVGCLWNLYLKQRRNRSVQNQDVTEAPEDV